MFNKIRAKIKTKTEKVNFNDCLAVFMIVCIGILFTLYFKIKNSMNFLNLDELLWMYRSRFFIDGISNLDFSNLIQSSHPGIMVMWAVGPFMKIINYDFNLIVNLINELNSSGIGYNIINSTEYNQQIYHNHRSISILFNIPIITIVISFVLSLYYLLKKLLFNKWQIAFSLILVVTTPYYIYFTTPTDKFVGMFSVVSILCLLIYLSKKGGKLFFIASAIFASFAVLSKMSALFLLPYVLFVIVFYSKILNIFLNRNGSSLKLNNIVVETKYILKLYFSYIAIFIVTSVVFLPTILSDPRSILALFVRESSQRIITENQNSFVCVSVSYAYLTDNFLLSFNIFVMIIFLVFFFLILKKIRDKIYIEKEIIVLFVYFISFFAFIVMFSKTYSFRYLVPILIIFQIISGIGIYELINSFIEKNKIKDKKVIYYWAIACILISQVLLIYYSEIEHIENLPSFY
ncbi:MAG: glycosyltransferase family 39 protein [Candidatus Pacebacteria bacterium]|nr:glycosyltransferase family 39 protein [Candidatus Paceibacterota bacterium]